MTPEQAANLILDALTNTAGLDTAGLDIAAGLNPLAEHALAAKRIAIALDALGLLPPEPQPTDRRAADSPPWATTRNRGTHDAGIEQAQPGNSQVTTQDQNQGELNQGD